MLSSLVSLSMLSACGAKPTSTSTPLPTNPTPTVTVNHVTPGPVIASKQESSIMDADLALSFGDYEQAKNLYLKAQNNPEQKPLSLYGQALTAYQSGDLFQARTLLHDLQRAYPDSLQSIRANVLNALMAEKDKLTDSAIQSWKAYAQARPGILDAYLWEHIGDLYLAKDDREQALQAYRQGSLANQLGNSTSLLIKLANCYAQDGQNDVALASYKEVYFKSQSDYEKAQMDLLIGRILLSQGKSTEAYSYYQDAVDNFPQTYDAYSALVALLEADEPVSELQRGMINYYREQYTLAIEAFDRFLVTQNDGADKALYFKALSVRTRGLTQAAFSSEERIAANRMGGLAADKEAIQIWNELINQHPQSPYYIDAIEDIIYTQNSYMGQIQLAIDTALAFVAKQHSELIAPGLLHTAASYSYLNGDLQHAAEYWTRIGVEFPSSEEAWNGLLFGGSLYYQLKQYDHAEDCFNRLISQSADQSSSAAAWMWLGKVSNAKGEAERAQGYYKQAQSVDPNGYYGIRATQLSADQSPFSLNESLNFNIDWAEERQTASVWLLNAFGLPSSINTDDLSSLQNNPVFIQANELDRLGLYEEASQKYERLRADYADDALNSFRLIPVFMERGYFYSALLSAKSISKLAGYEGEPVSPSLPPYFSHLQYGPYYLPWVQQRASEFGLSPLLLFAMISQESQFNVHALSSAGAGGLMQIMPGTATQIATETKFPANFTQEQLKNPYYNLYFGSNYIARQFYGFNNNSYYALASYNAGPGNVLKWLAQGDLDEDVFLNLIPYSETRLYIRRITELFRLYSIIYMKP